jgi:GT2 family glycosyltransferase
MLRRKYLSDPTSHTAPSRNRGFWSLVFTGTKEVTGQTEVGLLPNGLPRALDHRKRNRLEACRIPSRRRRSRSKRVPQQTPQCHKVGIVAIGRNEGERLRKCLSSARKETSLVVYVDTSSTDGSVEFAKRAGCVVVELDTKLPFTAARARNIGCDRLRQLTNDISYVQFIDGDCEIVPGWIDKAIAFLDSHDDVAVVCGRRRERYPDRSIYNWLCDVEWNASAGETKACGGDALMRVDAYAKIGGYRADIIAGEEPELCVRMRAAGWRIWRLETDMTLHDAAMTHFGQWWRRAVRTGYAYAQGADLHGAPPERHRVWEVRRAWVLGIWLPLACIAAGLVFGAWGWAALMIYPMHLLQKVVRGSGPLRLRLRLALFYVLGHFPEGWGVIMFTRDRFLGRQARLIEYK